MTPAFSPNQEPPTLNPTPVAPNPIHGIESKDLNVWDPHPGSRNPRIQYMELKEAQVPPEEELAEQESNTWN